MGTITNSHGISTVQVPLQEAVSILSYFSSLIYSKLEVLFLFSIFETFLFANELMLGWGVVAGKDFEGEKEAYSSAEWQERVEKWKIRQEKRGLVTKDDGGNDQGDEDDFLYVLILSSLYISLPKKTNNRPMK